MPVTFHGSPTHVLIVHLIVVLLPAAVIAAVILVAVPATRRAFSLLTLLVAFIACVAIPFAFLSGSKLEARLPPSPLIREHVRLAHELLPLAAVFGLVLAVFVAVDLVMRSQSGRLNDLERRFMPTPPDLGASAPSRRLTTAYRTSAGLLVVLAVLTGIQVYRVGDAGAKAAWSGRLSPTALAASGAQADRSSHEPVSQRP
jgi:uncharacterized membrane protein